MVCEQIAQKMAQRGYKYPSNKCEVKFKNSKQKYIKTVDHNNQTGNTPKKRSFYEQLADIFAFNPFVLPVAECANLAGFKKMSPAPESDGVSPPKVQGKGKTLGEQQAKKERKRKSSGDIVEVIKEFQQEQKKVEAERMKRYEEMYADKMR